MSQDLSPKLENIISGHKINNDDAAWLRAALARTHQPEAAQQPAQVVPEGFALVPIEPTEAMLEAARDVKRQRLVRAATELKQGKRPDTIGMAMAVNEEWAAMVAASQHGERAE